MPCVTARPSLTSPGPRNNTHVSGTCRLPHLFPRPTQLLAFSIGRGPLVPPWLTPLQWCGVLLMPIVPIQVGVTALCVERSFCAARSPPVAPLATLSPQLCDRHALTARPLASQLQLTYMHAS